MSSVAARVVELSNWIASISSEEINSAVGAYEISNPEAREKLQSNWKMMTREIYKAKWDWIKTASSPIGQVVKNALLEMPSLSFGISMCDEFGVHVDEQERVTLLYGIGRCDGPMHIAFTILIDVTDTGFYIHQLTAKLKRGRVEDDLKEVDCSVLCKAAKWEVKRKIDHVTTEMASNLFFCSNEDVSGGPPLLSRTKTMILGCQKPKSIIRKRESGILVGKKH